MSLKGELNQTEHQGSLDSGARINASLDGQDATLEFKVCCNMEGGEFLGAISFNKSSSIHFGILAEEGNMDLAAIVGGKTIVALGPVPPSLQVFLQGKTNWMLFEKYAEAVAYSIGLSLVGHEVDRHEVMAMADHGELEGLSDAEFEDLLNSLRVAMGREVYVVKLRLKIINRQDLVGNLFAERKGKIIDA